MMWELEKAQTDAFVYLTASFNQTSKTIVLMVVTKMVQVRWRNMFEDFLNALQNFRRNKTRTILSLLGVIIGVASVIIITTLGQSATQNIKGSFGSSGL